MRGIRVERALSGWRAFLRNGDKASAPAAAEATQRAQEEVPDDQHDHAADPEPARDERKQAPQRVASTATKAHAATAGCVLEIAAFPLVAEPHRLVPPAEAQCS